MSTLRLLFFFVLAYAISWIIWMPLYLPAFGIHLPVPFRYQHALGGFGPMIAAFIIKAIYEGRAGVMHLLKNMFTLRAPLYIAIALFSPLFIIVLAAIVSYFVSGHMPSFSAIGISKEYPEFGIAGFSLFNLISFGYGEEVGWRGIALPEFQKRFSPIVSAILLTVFWALWHLPLFCYRPGYVSMDISGVVGWLLSLLTGSILLTWMYNKSRYSLLVCAIFHATVDIAFMADMGDKNIVGYAGAIITIWGIAVMPFTIKKKAAIPLSNSKM